MNDYPVLSKLLEYYQHYSFWLILAVLLNTFLLVHINRQLQEVGPLSKNRAGYGALELQSVCLILFTLAAAFLLSINLGLDEFDSMEGVNSMLAKGIISEHSLAFLSFSIMFAHQPIYALMLNLIIRLSGLEYFGLLLRSISVFWATLTVYLTYKFSFKILKNKYIAYFSATFLCLHSLFYFYARRVEGYSLFCFLALLSYYYFWNEFIIEENNSLWKYVTASIACLMVHYLTLFIILSQLITMVLLKWNKNILASRSMIRFVKALLIFCFTVILVAPVIYLSTVNNEFLFKNNWFRNNWQNNFYLGRNYLPDIISNLTRLILGSPKGEFFIYLYILIFIIIIYKIRKYNLQFFTLLIGVFLSGILYEGLFLLFLWKAIGGFYPNFRHLIWVVPFTAMVYGYGAYILARQAKSCKIVGWVILSVVLLCNAYQSYVLCFNPQTPAYTKVANYIKKECRKDDFIGRPVSWIEPFVYGEQSYPYNVKRGEVNMDNFSLIRTKYKRIWALVAREDCFGVPHFNPEAINRWLNMLRQNLSLEKTWHAYKLDVYLFTITHD